MKIEKRNFNIFHIHVVERERNEKENTKGIRFEIKRKLIIGTRRNLVVDNFANSVSFDGK